jgi:hypothetical protein
MSQFISLFFDIVILAALGAIIFYCLRLSRQFNRLQADRKAFETLIQSLNVASARAEAAIRAIKEAAIGSGDALQDRINKSRALSDELEIMIQAGDSLANRLQTLAEKSRRAHVAINENPQTERQPRTRAERELLEAVKIKVQS